MPESQDDKNKNGEPDYETSWAILTDPHGEANKPRDQQEKDATTLMVTASATAATIAVEAGILTAAEATGVGAAVGAVMAADWAIGEGMYALAKWLGAAASGGGGFYGAHPDIVRDIEANREASRWWIHYPGRDGWRASGRPAHNYPELGDYPAYRSLPSGTGPNFGAWDPPVIPDAAPGSFEALWYPIFARLWEVNTNSTRPPWGIDPEKALHLIVGMWNQTHDGPGETVPTSAGWGAPDRRVLVPLSAPVTINRGAAKPIPLLGGPAIQNELRAGMRAAVSGGALRALGGLGPAPSSGATSGGGGMLAGIVIGLGCVLWWMRR